MNSKSFDSYKRQLKRKIDSSSTLMSNSKWRKLFKALAIIDPFPYCEVKLILDDQLRRIRLPAKEEDVNNKLDYQHPFGKSIINDNIISGCGPVLYKEIDFLFFPKQLEFKRTNRNELLKPMIKKQETSIIIDQINTLGKYNLLEDDKGLFLKAYS